MKDCMEQLVLDFNCCREIAEVNKNCGVDSEYRFWFGKADGIQHAIELLAKYRCENHF